MAQPNRTKNVLLGFLSWGPMSGYDLRQVIEGSISNFWAESYGRIYPMLAQLAEDELATRVESRSEGGRLRHTYQLTDQGRAAFAEWLQAPVVPRPLRNERLLKLFFGARADVTVSLKLVEQYRIELTGALEHYAEIRERLEAVKDANDTPPDHRFWLMTLRSGEIEAEAQLTWCAEVTTELKALSTGNTKEISK